MRSGISPLACDHSGLSDRDITRREFNALKERVAKLEASLAPKQETPTTEQPKKRERDESERRAALFGA